MATVGYLQTKIHITKAVNNSQCIAPSTRAIVRVVKEAYRSSKERRSHDLDTGQKLHPMHDIRTNCSFYFVLEILLFISLVIGSQAVKEDSPSCVIYDLNL